MIKAKKMNRLTGHWKKLLLPVLGLGLLLFLARYSGAGNHLGEARGWISSLGFWGPAVFILIYAAAVTALVPGSALTVAAGALFGSVTGVITVSIASTLGAAFSFLISRYAARGLVEQWLAGNEKFKRLDDLVGRHGSVVVAVTRLVPLFPYTLLNYGFGLTGISFRTYISWSWLCMLPGTILYVVGGDAAAGLASGRKTPWVPLCVAAGAAAALFFLAAKARKILRDKERKINHG